MDLVPHPTTMRNKTEDGKTEVKIMGNTGEVL